MGRRVSGSAHAPTRTALAAASSSPRPKAAPSACPQLSPPHPNFTLGARFPSPGSSPLSSSPPFPPQSGPAPSRRRPILPGSAPRSALPQPHLSYSGISRLPARPSGHSLVSSPGSRVRGPASPSRRLTNSPPLPSPERVPPTPDPWAAPWARPSTALLAAGSCSGPSSLCLERVERPGDSLAAGGKRRPPVFWTDFPALGRCFTSRSFHTLLDSRRGQDAKTHLLPNCDFPASSKRAPSASPACPLSAATFI
ncbi:uncharacterized protein LOC127545464 [Antechinus flavipes]|uniref:uncharacterized protein LOC127545464 n=1 Tax=Antechinus flavipes TaxID=38775 RepID=UPI002235C41A|nr:uncharacterized protein LOC127545464 [Antechinus flavipes]